MAPEPRFEPSSAWADGIITPAEGAALVDVLGFVLVHGDRPEDPAGANLVVAFRARPTERAFDPERARYWATVGVRGLRHELDRTTSDAFPAFSWGTIVIEDRLGVTNSFLTFGGLLRVGDPRPDERIAIFGSPAPIMRWGGHSQGTDPHVNEVGAFFGRVRAALTADPTLEKLLSAASPLERFASFVVDARTRFAASQTLRAARPVFDAWSQERSHHLEAVAPEALAGGRELLRAFEAATA